MCGWSSRFSLQAVLAYPQRHIMILIEGLYKGITDMCQAQLQYHAQLRASQKGQPLGQPLGPQPAVVARPMPPPPACPYADRNAVDAYLLRLFMSAPSGRVRFKV